MLTRREFGFVAASAASVILTSCTSQGRRATSSEPPSDADFAARFAGFEPAAEPNGDPAKVQWPSFVTDAAPEVRQLYEFQITHGELMRYMPCFCGCGESAGHRNNRDCYVAAVHADGSVELDSMAPTWEICLGVTRDVMAMLEEGMAPRAIRAAIDRTYAEQIEFATPTPYPPA